MRDLRIFLTFSRWQWVELSIVIIVGGLVTGTVGLIVGADYGGNHCNSFEFNGLRGYEATGQLGLIVGATLGSIAAGKIALRLLIAQGKRKINEQRHCDNPQ